MLCLQTQHDLFFIDWEQPRTTSLSKAGDEEGGGGDGPDADGNLPVRPARAPPPARPDAAQGRP